jgi:hypothetical protein
MLGITHEVPNHLAGLSVPDFDCLVTSPGCEEQPMAFGAVSILERIKY